jgi:hypothetical protein
VFGVLIRYVRGGARHHKDPVATHQQHQRAANV